MKKIEFGNGLTTEERQLIIDFYAKNPQKLKKIKTSKEIPKEKETSLNEESYVTFVELTKYASYSKILKLIKKKELIEGEHYIYKKNSIKRKWKQKAVDKLKDIYYLANEEKEEFEKLYMYFVTEKKMSLSEFSRKISKKTTKSERAVYNFFYTIFVRKVTKSTYLEYMRAMTELKREMKK